MKSVLKELGAFKKQVLLIVLTVLGTTMCTLGLPSLLMILIDNAIPNKDIVLVLEVGGIMLLLVVIGILCGIATSRLSATVSMGVGRNMRSKVFRKVQYFSQTEMDKFSTSSLITRTNNDINQVQGLLNQCWRIAIQ